MVMEELTIERQKAALLSASLESEIALMQKDKGGKMTLIQERKWGLRLELEQMRARYWVY